MKRNRIRFVLLMIGMFVTGCETSGISKTMETQRTEAQRTEAQRTEAQRAETQRAEEAEGTAGLSFDEMTNLEFYFSSGAGAWRTILEIEADGSFSGVYSDSDMGVVGEGYPNGTYYICEFEGTFTQPEKINEYTYSMQIEQIDYEHAPETQEIIDGVLYSYSTAYGLEGAEEIYIYLPGAPLLELPQEYRNWVLHDMVDPDTEELPFYGLYNVKEQNGFSSHVVSDKIYDMVAEAERQAGIIRNSLAHDPLNQAEMNIKSADLYVIWDDLLNALWAEVKNSLSEDKFQTLLEEQRSWIAEKEKAVKEAGKEFAGGTMQHMVMNMKAADITEERVYELYELLKQV